MTTDDTKRAFLKELAALLDKYDVSILFDDYEIGIFEFEDGDYVVSNRHHAVGSGAILQLLDFDK